MLSSPFERIHDWTMSGVTCYHRLGHHTRSEDVGRGMPACPLGSTHGLMMSGMGCHHHLWTTYMVARDRVCYAIIAIVKHTRSDDVRRDMPSLPLDSTHCGMTSAWYAIITVGQHIRLENVRRGIPSWSLSIKHCRTTSSVEGNHLP